MSERRAIALKGVSWSHPRGYDPLIAASTRWRAERGVEITWDRRSLQDFEDFPIDALARRYDLMVIDHPHIGDAAAARSLAALDGPDCVALAAGSLGPSYRSYTWAARQWALPIDAAAQVQALRPDLLSDVPQTWGDVLSLAGARRVDCPLRPPHSLMAIYTLCANLGRPCDSESPDLFDREVGARAIGLLTELATWLDDSCYRKDPIDVLEAMAAPMSRIALSPLVYGYVSYAQPGFRPRVLSFANIVSAGRMGPVGSALGGAGMAVSAHSAEPDVARDFAFWLASETVQRTLYAEAGGQPAHAGAWSDASVNAAAHGFYANTRATLDHAWLRPRHPGYPMFQRAASERLNTGLRARESATHIIGALNALYARNLSAARAGVQLGGVA